LSLTHWLMNERNFSDRDNLLIFFYCVIAAPFKDNAIAEPFPANRRGELFMNEFEQISEEAELQLWNLICEGDLNAYTRIHDLYYHIIFDYTLSLLKSDEIASELWMSSYTQVWPNRKKFNGKELKKFFLSTIKRKTVVELRMMLNEWSERKDRDERDFPRWAARRKPPGTEKEKSGGGNDAE
jgi:hypothetical protein